jgi:hypothetical protein
MLRYILATTFEDAERAMISIKWFYLIVVLFWVAIAVWSYQERDYPWVVLAVVMVVFALGGFYRPKLKR